MRTTLIEENAVVFSDEQVLVVKKPAGIPVQPDLSRDADLLSVLKEKYGDLWLVHRLDRTVGGLVVFARTQKAAAFLSSIAGDGGKFVKTYLALVPGEVTGSGHWEDLLFHDTRSHRAFVVDRQRGGVKRAILDWETVAVGTYAGAQATLVKVQLDTGRFHQIRVQFSSRKLPLLGDGKYGSRVKCPIALFSYRLSFPHPITGRSLTFQLLPGEVAPWADFAPALQTISFE